MAGDLYRRGSSLVSHLAYLREKYGYFEYRSGYVLASNPAKIAAFFDYLRSADGKAPYLQAIAGAEGPNSI